MERSADRLLMCLGLLALAASCGLHALDLSPGGWTVPAVAVRYAARPGDTLILQYANASETPSLTSALPSGITLDTISSAVNQAGTISIGIGSQASGTYVLTFKGQAAATPTAGVTIVVRPLATAPTLTLTSTRPITPPPSGSDLLVRCNPGGTTVVAWSVEDAVPSAQHMPVLTGLRRDLYSGYSSGTNSDWVLAAPLPATVTSVGMVDQIATSNANNYAARWRGSLIGEASANRFQVNADDGTRLYIGNTADGSHLAIAGGDKIGSNPDVFGDSWSTHSPRDFTTPDLVMTGGRDVAIPMRLDFFQGGGGQNCSLRRAPSTTPSSFSETQASSYLQPQTTDRQDAPDGATVQTAQVGPITATTVSGTITLGLPAGASQIRSFSFRSVDPDGFVSGVKTVSVQPNAAPRLDWLRRGSASGPDVAASTTVVGNPQSSVALFYSVSDDLTINSANTLTVSCLSVTPDSAVPFVVQPASATVSSSTGSFSIGLLDMATYAGGTISVEMGFEDGDGALVRRTIRIAPNAPPTASYNGSADQSLPATITLAAMTEDQDSQTAAVYEVVLKDQGNWTQRSTPINLQVIVDSASESLAASVFSTYSAYIHTIDNSQSPPREVVHFEFKTKADANSLAGLVLMGVNIVDGDGLTSVLKVQVGVWPRNDPCQLAWTSANPARLDIDPGAGFTPVISAVSASDPDGQVGNAQAVPTPAPVATLTLMAIELKQVDGNPPSNGELVTIQGAGTTTVVGSDILVNGIKKATWQQQSRSRVTISPEPSANLAECLALFGLVRYGWMLGVPPAGLQDRVLSVVVTEPGYGGSSNLENTSNSISRTIRLLPGAQSVEFSVPAVALAPGTRVELKPRIIGFSGTTRITVFREPGSGMIVYETSPNVFTRISAGGVGVPASTTLYYENINGDVSTDGFQLNASDGTQALNAAVGVTIAYQADVFTVVGDPVIPLPLPVTSVTRDFIASSDISQIPVTCVEYPAGTVVFAATGWTVSPQVQSDNRTIRLTVTYTPPAVTPPATPSLPPYWTHFGLRVGPNFVLPVSVRGAPIPRPGNPN